MVEFYELINSDDEGNYIIYLKDFIEYVVDKLKTLTRERLREHARKMYGYG